MRVLMLSGPGNGRTTQLTGEVNHGDIFPFEGALYEVCKIDGLKNSQPPTVVAWEASKLHERLSRIRLRNKIVNKCLEAGRPIPNALPRIE